MKSSPRFVWTGGAIALAMVLLAIGVVFSVTPSGTGEAHEDGLAGLRRAVNRYQYTAKAEANGWVLVPTLDHCFSNPGVGGMGFHYIKPGILDLVLEETEPEALVYAPQSNGRLELAAVEYIVPKAPWDSAHPGGELPKVHGIDLHENASLGVYVLHIWLFEDNPDGMFEDWNPDVVCPTPAP